ncbi:GntR family transcriptional regulator/MocR family aminotransferase [Bacillus pakistanensis]|uniref:GntR family transcriptional regulator/MocR family aminotransferase n=1 Tax=Rossellomorea pakistanensis TaxID=992288 RepID=A0ABS2NJ65_9BACI|nr:PLP-dependent aminotransferase family protein [Bacillus pakistanensis]MBM7587904.1 GntR family transcriptional regulator/MocR family aminotransferase [Bacillus pakistanensis]
MIDLTPNLDSQRNEPLYIQLYNYIKDEIKGRSLAPHTKLPSKRKLASHLQISQNTIEAAYEQLVAEGYIETLPRKGFFVCEVEPSLITGESPLPYVEEKSYRNQNYICDFTNTGIDTGAFPFAIYRKLANDVLRKDNENVLLLGHPQGEWALREAIAKYLFESRGVRCSPSQIVIGAGTPYLLGKVFQLLKESVFAVENPGYHRKLVAFEKSLEEVKMIPLDQDGLVLSKLEESQANVAIVTPSHQFPCGMIMPITRRMQLLKWAEQEENRFIIEDDYDSEFRYTGKPIPALQGLDANEKVIYIGTFSKALLPSLRVSYMVLPKPLVQTYQQDFFFYTQTVSRVDQEILSRFIQEEHWEKHIHKMRVVYQKKRNVLVSAIATYFPTSVEVIGQDSGLHILLRPNNGMTEAELISQAAKQRIKVYPVSTFGEFDNRTVLLGFAILSEEKIQEAIQLLSDAWFNH